MSKTIDLKNNLDAGFQVIKQKDTWKRVAGLACGSLLGSVSVMLTNKLTNKSSRVLQYGTGTVASGTIAVIALGMGYENIGLGSAMVGAAQALNTVTSLVFDKSIAELVNN